MKTRRPAAATRHANHERWIVSYADFVTLLFAFFVVMFATANADRSRAKAVGEALKAAFSQGSTTALRQALKEAAQHEKPQDDNALRLSLIELHRTEALLKQTLQDEIKKEQVEVYMEPRGLVISFKQGALFDSGDATLKESARPAMRKLANVTSSLSNQMRLEGHTDNLPIHNDRYRNNWELSSSRSIALLQMLTQDYGLALDRLSVSGYADVAPVATNSTEEGRSRNRRVDVVILSSAAGWSEPGKYRRSSQP